MKQIALILVFISALLFGSCSNQKDIFTDEQKLYVLSENYEGLGEPGLVYVPHISTDFVSVINPSGMKLVGSIKGGNGPCAVLMLKDGSKGYIANYQSSDVTVFDPKTNRKITTIQTYEHPTALLELPGRNKVLVTHQSDGGMCVISTIDNSVTKMAEYCSGFMSYLKSADKIYLPQIFAPFIQIVDPNTLHIIKQIETGGRPMSMAVSSDEKFGYLANYDSAEVAKVDLTTDQIVLKIKNIPSPRWIEFSPDNSLLMVTNVKDNSVTVIDPKTDAVVKTIFGIPMPTDVKFTPDGNYALVCSQGSASVAVIEMKSMEIKETIKTASNPITIFQDNRP
ncbi:MAG: hypothetical protein JNK43_09960 [Ignavibacteria bacterium]|nr:hypothetical protein [Ignavibacteria bacterium]